MRTYETNRDPLSSDWEINVQGNVIPMEVNNYWLNTSTMVRYQCLQVITGVSALFEVVPNLTTGTFTPALEFGGESTGITYDSQTGSYIRVGTGVNFNIFIDLSSKGTATGDATITGMPFNNGSSPAAFITYFNNCALTASYTTFGARIAPSQQLIRLIQQGPGLALANLDNTLFTDTTQLFVSGMYFL